MARTARNAAPAAAVNQGVFHLDNTEVQDEADIFGYTFAIVGPDDVEVTPRYSGYPENETPKTYSRHDARNVWKRCIAAGFAPRAPRS